jgi:hypothetical protein
VHKLNPAPPIPLVPVPFRWKPIGCPIAVPVEFVKLAVKGNVGAEQFTPVQIFNFAAPVEHCVLAMWFSISLVISTNTPGSRATVNAAAALFTF